MKNNRRKTTIILLILGLFFIINAASADAAFIPVTDITGVSDETLPQTVRESDNLGKNTSKYKAVKVISTKSNILL